MKDKNYIVYRYFFNTMLWTYERLELSEKELKKYIVKHQNEMKNIEVFFKSERVKISIDVNVEIEERS